ncbi:MAG: hypothetical protein M3442_11000, partial [Chloroflexota bacterium]|nr:hypothetical protein [Chloroflexota bacterium]
RGEPPPAVGRSAPAPVRRENSVCVSGGAVGDHQVMLDWVPLLACAGVVALRSRHALLAENLLLRQQLAVARRARRRPCVRWHDRLFWVVARRLVTDWRRHLVLVDPETVLR